MTDQAGWTNGSFRPLAVIAVSNRLMQFCSVNDGKAPPTSGRPSVPYRTIVGIWLAVFVLAAFNEWRILGDYDKSITAILGVLGYLLLVRFRSLGSARCPWTVTIEDGDILTSDGKSSPRRLPITHLRRVVVATDDSGPWGDDVLFYLFSDAVEPVGVFPLEAAGCQDFLGWLSKQHLFQDSELAKAMGSTEVAEFEIFNLVRNGS